MARARDGSDGCPQLARRVTPAAVCGSAAARPAVAKRNRGRGATGDAGFRLFGQYVCAVVLAVVRVLSGSM